MCNRKLYSKKNINFHTSYSKLLKKLFFNIGRDPLINYSTPTVYVTVFSLKNVSYYLNVKTRGKRIEWVTLLL